ncbi:MAG: hypothetical protein ABEH38_04025 [Flavobacteriales bacterium]
MRKKLSAVRFRRKQGGLDILLLLIILGVGVFLRFDTLASVSLGNDELSALQRTRFDSFPEMIQKGVIPDGHPAFVQSFLYVYTGLVLRLPDPFPVRACRDPFLALRLPDR